MLGRALDSLIAIASPTWAVRRSAARLALGRVQAASRQHRAMEKMLGGRNSNGYEAGRRDRLKNRSGEGSTHENDLPWDEIKRTRWGAWKLFRNNPQARKVCRTLGAKVIGRGLSPQPQAVTDNGLPNVAFRKRAREVWTEWCKEADYRGKPGRGGHDFTSLSKTALRAAVLSGGVLYRFHHLDTTAQGKLGLSLPLQVQLINVDRLDEQKHDDVKFFRGVELGSDGKVAAYWILKAGAVGTAPTAEERSTRVTVDKVGYLYVEDDIDQILGSSWFGAALLTMGDRRSYEYSELVAAEMASCFVGAYKAASGQQIGLPGAAESGELTDAEGNPVTALQAGMMLRLGKEDAFEIVGSNRPNNSAEGFLSHLVRSEAVSMPGVKSSTLTGDYRNSSFSSERSADNDVWPEIEEVQDWFAAGFCQVVFEEVITTAVLAGKFDQVPGFSAQDFTARKREYLAVHWQGPVPRSINPKDDADAARERVKNTNSTPQIESAKEGRDWRENIDGIAEFIAYCRERKLPESIWQQALGIAQKDAPGSGDTPPRKSEQDQDEEFATRRDRALQQAARFPIMNSAGA